MVDGGKHAFPADWLVSFMKDVHKIGLNTIHLTVANDQRFNLAMDDNVPLGDGTYSREDWRLITAEARSLHNMTIVPEISVPLYAASWANIFGTEILVDCPQYICGAGYGIPWNIHHPKMETILQRVFGRIVEVLDRPPLLHLGSNDVSFTEPCWKEAAQNFRRGHSVFIKGPDPMSDYDFFEEMLEQVLVQNVGYSKEQIIRQGNMGRAHQSGQVTGRLWQYKNHEDALHQTDPYLLQPNSLNLAINAMDPISGWDIYNLAGNILKQHWKPGRDSNKLFQGILVSTEAMNATMIRQRNVMGRLLAISMAFQAIAAGSNTETRMAQKYVSRKEFEESYLFICKDIFSHDEPTTAPPDFCDLFGGTVPMDNSEPKDILPSDDYEMMYFEMWNNLKDDLCHHMTATEEQFHVQAVSGHIMHQIQNTAFSRFWHTFGNDSPVQEVNLDSKADLIPEESESAGQGDENGRHKNHSHTHQAGALPSLLHESFMTMGVEQRGLIVDMVGCTASSEELENLMRGMASLGLNTLQLSLLNEHGCALHVGDSELLYHVVPTPKNGEILSDSIIDKIVTKAANYGIALIPEISITTRSTGWYHAGFLIDCPKTLCESGEICNDVTRGSLIPVLLDMVRLLHGLFHSSSPYIHLGSDERRLSQPCWNESGKTPDYNLFEARFSEILLTKGWYEPSKVLRWENKEGVHYANRTGDMTEYQYRIPTELGSPFFGSLIIDNATDPWAVYTKTRDWVAAKPAGLFAKISKVSLNEVVGIKPKLIAFTAGLSSSLPFMKSKEELDTFLSDICKKYSTWCEHTAPTKRKARGKEPSHLDAMCKSMTHSSVVTVMRSIPAVVTPKIEAMCC
ncbi:glycosyl hydrolase family 20 protein [Nitzschia inconspicua]|uniref:beta-N-acetylhexosaminidase n=1 Tax=Nitzschia inconspicua TaxID=303405 RepID=A0A9K3Q3E3_9STRA|nr:glycosyl hydrolase family 20 protein [Nitzschia inconspicua]